MMMDDFDDEQTIEDEELQDDADGAEELALLEEVIPTIMHNCYKKLLSKLKNYRYVMCFYSSYVLTLIGRGYATRTTDGVIWIW